MTPTPAFTYGKTLRDTDITYLDLFPTNLMVLALILTLLQYLA